VLVSNHETRIKKIMTKVKINVVELFGLNSICCYHEKLFSFEKCGMQQTFFLTKHSA